MSGNFTEADRETITKIAQIDSNVTGLKEDFKDFKESFKNLSSSIPIMRNDINSALTMSSENKILYTALEVRIKNLENYNNSKIEQAKGVKHFWRDILSFIGFISMATGAILGILAVVQHLKF